MFKLILTTTLILAVASEKAVSKQFYSTSCYRAGDANNKVVLPNAPPCWSSSNLDFAFCFEKTDDGNCPVWAVDIHTIKKEPTKPIKKCKPKKPTPGLVEVVLPQLGNKVVAPAEQIPSYQVTTPIPSSTPTPSSAYPVAPSPTLIPSSTYPVASNSISISSSSYSVVPAPSASPLPNNPSNGDDDYKVAPVPVGGVCPLPQDSNIMPVTPELGNRGWAISPDQTCGPGKWCPYACKPGMYSAQFDQTAKVNGPSAGSMNGGLFCNAQGQLIKPFPERPLCAQGMNNVFIDNRLSGKVSLCQTVYPGNEAMLVPTIATPNTLQVINTPPKTYWESTSSHYYINPVDSSLKDCIWGKKDKPVGNWSPFVTGSNDGFEGNTFVKIAINPEFVAAGLHNLVTKPYKLTIECDGPCNSNVGCQITINDPISKFCVTTVPKGSKARVVLSY